MKEKLLIVDDAELNRAVLEELLSSEYETICACGGREAMEIMERERDNLALVLLDVMMPDIDGYEVLEYMNFNGLLKHTPVIMVTAADSAEDEEKCLRLGAMDFVRKPYVTDVVKRRVKNKMCIRDRSYIMLRKDTSRSSGIINASGISSYRFPLAKHKRLCCARGWKTRGFLKRRAC